MRSCQGMSAGELLKQANQLKRSGRLDEAIALYHQAIKLNPYFAWTHYGLSDALAKLGHIEEAIIECSHAVYLNNKSVFLREMVDRYLQQNYVNKCENKNNEKQQVEQLINKFKIVSNVVTHMNMKEPTLTIGIPTYNRCEAVTSNLKHLQDSNLAENIKILVIDNCSLDDSYESLLKISNSETTRIVRNDENIGYAGNFIKLFKECDTDYLLITSDEDYIITENLPNLLEFIKTTSADFISPQAIIKDKVYRGKLHNQKIEPIEYKDSSFYLSGTVYKVRSCIKPLQTIEKHYIAQLSSSAVLYPQTILVIMLILGGVCFWCNIPICWKVFNLKSQIIGTKQEKYYGIYSRWLQYMSLIDFFIDLLNYPEYYSLHQSIKEMLQYHLNTLKGILRSSLLYERNDIPELGVYLESNNREIEIVQRNNKYHFTILK